MASGIFPDRQNPCGGSGVILPLETTRSDVGFLLPELGLNGGDRLERA